MKINIAQVKQEIGSDFPFRFITSREQLGLDKEATSINGEVVIEGEVVNKGWALEVRGRIRANGEYVCGRCLDAVSLIVEADFSESYAEEGTETDEEDIVFFSGDEIDITELIRENLILAEPLTPVCQADCQGLCPICGTNLNAATCSCDRRSIDPRLAVLTELLAKKQT